MKDGRRDDVRVDVTFYLWSDVSCVSFRNFNRKGVKVHRSNAGGSGAQICLAGRSRSICFAFARARGHVREGKTIPSIIDDRQFLPSVLPSCLPSFLLSLLSLRRFFLPSSLPSFI